MLRIEEDDLSHLHLRFSTVCLCTHEEKQYGTSIRGNVIQPYNISDLYLQALKYICVLILRRMTEGWWDCSDSNISLLVFLYF